jgi:excinuclease ABC subunit A
VIDLGPEGGHRGGQIIAQGTPEELATAKQSYTGQFLARTLGLGKDKEKSKSKATKATKTTTRRKSAA